jgi:hypothetical protein
MNTNNNDSPFGDVIYIYTRAHAVADGSQIDVTKLAQEAGIRFPVFLTRAVYDAYVTVPQGVEGQDEAGRTWDILTLLRHAIRKSQPGQTGLPFSLYVRNDNRRPPARETHRHLRPAGRGRLAARHYGDDAGLTRPHAVDGLATVRQPLFRFGKVASFPNPSRQRASPSWTSIVRCAGLDANAPFPARRKRK